MSMFTSITQSKIISYISLVVLLVAALVATTVFAQWVNPTGTQQNPSSALNRGPVTQVKDGRISIGSSTQMQSAALEVDGPALLQGGLYVEGDPNISSVILGDVFVGYQGVPGTAMTAGTASTYTLTGNVLVSRNIGAENLKHADAGDRQPVCTTLEGWLIPCVDVVMPPVDEPSLPTNVNWHYYDGNTKSYGYMDRHDTNGNEIFSVDYQRLQTNGSSWVTVLDNDEVDTSPQAPGGTTRLSDVTGNNVKEIQFADSNVSSLHPFDISRVRVSLDGSTFGPWYYLYQNNATPSLSQAEIIAGTPFVSLATVWVECTDPNMQQSIASGVVAMTCFEHNIQSGALGAQNIQYTGPNTAGNVTVVEFVELFNHQNPTSTNIQPPVDHPHAVLGVALVNNQYSPLSSAPRPLRTVVPLQDY